MFVPEEFSFNISSVIVLKYIFKLTLINYFINFPHWILKENVLKVTDK